MLEHQFDEFLRNKLKGHASPVPENMWERVQPKDDDDRRKVGFWIWYMLPLFLLGTLAISYYIYKKESPNRATSAVAIRTTSPAAAAATGPALPSGPNPIPVAPNLEEPAAQNPTSALAPGRTSQPAPGSASHTTTAHTSNMTTAPGPLSAPTAATAQASPIAGDPNPDPWPISMAASSYINDLKPTALAFLPAERSPADLTCTHLEKTRRSAPPFTRATGTWMLMAASSNHSSIPLQSP